MPASPAERSQDGSGGGSDAPRVDPSLPLIDLHRHLDGSLRLETILDLARQHRVALPADDLEGLRPHVQVVEPAPDLMAFIAKLGWMTAVLADLDACRRVARECVEDAAAEGLDAVELRFSPSFMAEPHRLDPAAVVAAVVEGVEEGRRLTGLPVGLIGILSRTYGPESCALELEALLTRVDDLLALDLAGDEAGQPAARFVEHFRRAREAGLRITVHAGEADGPRSVRDAIELLGAERIGHGIRAVQDPALMDRLAGSRIGLEVCPTSNLHTSTVASYEAHPLRRLVEAGLSVTINTDDPGISAIDLVHELERAAPACGLDAAQLRSVQAEALRQSFLDREIKHQLRRRAALRAGSAAST